MTLLLAVASSTHTLSSEHPLKPYLQSKPLETLIVYHYHYPPCMPRPSHALKNPVPPRLTCFCCCYGCCNPPCPQDLVSAIRTSQPLLQQILPSGGEAAECTGPGEQCKWGENTEENDAGEALASSPSACSGQGRDVPVLVSGAGHDTMAMAEITKVWEDVLLCPA
eukprot:1158335-Pelagomonas_calceolata.AAC.2